MLQAVLTISKAASIVLISVALGIELWNLGAGAMGESLPDFLQSALIYVQVVLVAHGLEAIIAARLAGTRQRQPLTSAIYTFFVGFPGLWELFQLSRSTPQ